ncbi:hypothetical protein HAX54_004528, partial [Datura stramonium]|nr:hypothetical protein [Datura stramonium]
CKLHASAYHESQYGGCEWYTDQRQKVSHFVLPRMRLKRGPQMANRGRDSTMNAIEVASL